MSKDNKTGRPGGAAGHRIPRGCSGVSVGAIIEQDNKILMIDRVKFPYGWACVAGHIDEGETPQDALVREVQEEVGLDIQSAQLALEEYVPWNECSKGTQGHRYSVFKCRASGELTSSESEVKNWKWVQRDELASLNLEPVWGHFFNKLGYLPS